MRSLRNVLPLLLLSLFASGCVMTSFLLRPEQRLLMKNLMKELEDGQNQLKSDAGQDRWDAVARVALEMSRTARRMQSVQPKNAADDFRIRSIELEHDLSLIASEAQRGNADAVREHVKSMSFTCTSCHRKFQKGRPW